jgi:hypothetical protein
MEEGKEKRSNIAICTPTRVSRLIISKLDIHAQMELTFSYFSVLWLRYDHRI